MLFRYAKRAQTAKSTIMAFEAKNKEKNVLGNISKELEIQGIKRYPRGRTAPGMVSFTGKSSVAEQSGGYRCS